MRRKKYLNNKDLLKEIHKSKNSFSSYVDEDRDHQYDIILPSLERVNMRTVAQAKRNRADRLGKQAYEEAIHNGEKVKQAQFAIDWKKIDKYDLVFRIMTYDHIPLDPGRKKNPKTVMDHHVRLNFPPYQHFRFNENDELVCVGKSHWTGGMDNGHFTAEGGEITKNLAMMFLKLVERYGTRYNWRNYTYNDEMQGTAITQLCYMGLQFNEDKSDNPFAYYTATITNSFTRVLNLEKKGQNIRDDILEQNGLNPSYTRQFANSDAKTSE